MLLEKTEIEKQMLMDFERRWKEILARDGLIDTSNFRAIGDDRPFELHNITDAKGNRMPVSSIGPSIVFSCA